LSEIDHALIWCILDQARSFKGEMHVLSFTSHFQIVFIFSILGD